jgi:hypothetical protein
VSYVIVNEVYVVEDVGKYEWLGSCICDKKWQGHIFAYNMFGRPRVLCNAEVTL